MSASMVSIAETGAHEAREGKRQYTVAELFCGCGGLAKRLYAVSGPTSRYESGQS
jgi:hypothetical protein